MRSGLQTTIQLGYNDGKPIEKQHPGVFLFPPTWGGNTFFVSPPGVRILGGQKSFPPQPLRSWGGKTLKKNRRLRRAIEKDMFLDSFSITFQKKNAIKVYFFACGAYGRISVHTHKFCDNNGCHLPKQPAIKSFCQYKTASR